LEGRRVSAITIQKILNDKGLGSRHERWLALERQSADQAIELTPEQAAFLENLNPCFRERHVESERPGQLLSADTFMVGTLKSLGRVYLHAVVDTYRSYAFGFVHVSRQPEEAVAVPHNDVLPFYAKLDLPVHAILTDNDREFCGTERHLEVLYVALDDIAHRKTKVGSPRTNGFVEASNGTVLDEFFRPKLRTPSTRASSPCRLISTPGCATTTKSGPTSATATRAAVHGRPWSLSSVSHLQDKAVKRQLYVSKVGARRPSAVRCLLHAPFTGPRLWLGGARRTQSCALRRLQICLSAARSLHFPRFARLHHSG
jgi:transposase InsO family protein